MPGYKLMNLEKVFRNYHFEVEKLHSVALTASSTLSPLDPATIISRLRLAQSERVWTEIAGC